MAKKRKSAAIFVALVAIIGIIGALVLGRATASCLPQKAEFYLPTGSTYTALLDTLEDNGVERMSVVALVGKLRKLDQSVKPGHYVLPAGSNAMGIVGTLRAGAQKPVKLTFNNIRTLDQLAGRLATQIEADSVAILAHLTNPTTAAKYDLKPEQLIGIFIPNTYEVWWTLTPEALTDRMFKEYNSFWNDSRKAKLARTKLSEIEVITLASIIYEETKVASEMPKIAGVYLNRMRRGIPLQACPTAKYAIGDFSIKRVLHKHTQVKSPYNTYLNRGLTPGPICLPSITAIDAVLDFENHSYLYFCAKEDFSGRHYFSKTLSEHNRYAKRYAAALSKAGIR